MYLATVLPGLESVLVDEVQTKISEATIQETARGKVFFASPAPWGQLLALRTADNLFHVLGSFRVGPHRADLADVRATVAALNPVAGPDLASRQAPAADTAVPRRERRPVTFFVNASRTGRHTYSRFELAEAATRGVLDRHPSWRVGEPTVHDVELRLDVTGDVAIFSRRLTPASFRFRGRERYFTPAALRPPVAHALVWLSRPAPDDRFVDPFCGSGTILAERLPYPGRDVLGGDPAPDVLRAARSNLFPPPEQGLGRSIACTAMPPADTDGNAPGRLGPGALPPGCIPTPRLTLLRWDARRLPLRDGVVDKVVTNLPFGRQVLGPDKIDAVYRGFVAELRRVLAPPGEALLLTDQVDALLDAAAPLRPEPLFTLSLKGLHPQIIRLRQG